MAIFLKKDLLNVAKSANLTVDLTKLGKVQINRLYKYLMNGNIVGEGIPAQVALGLYKQYRVPYVHTMTWKVEWRNLPAEALHEIQAVGSALKMAASGMDVGYNSFYSLNSMLSGEPSGEFPSYAVRRIVGYEDNAEKPYIDCIKSIKLAPTDTIKQLAESIISRSINEVTIQVYTGE